MTWLEKYLKEHPDKEKRRVIGHKCPYDFYWDADEFSLCDYEGDSEDICDRCWNQEIPEEKEEIDIEEIDVNYVEDKNEVEGIQQKIYDAYGIPREVMERKSEEFEEIADKMLRNYIMSASEVKRILDSGNRREFESGAVRDIQEGKGRCDLLALDVVGLIMHDPIFTYIDLFQDTGDEKNLYSVIDQIVYARMFPDHKTLFLEVAKHFEEGCKKYGENNWRRGIPAHCYIDSAVRHYLKHLRGDKDEPHDRAFCWNILCCIWTCLNKPELNDYRKVGEQDGSK